MILLVDNFDSFSHNLGRYLTLLGQTVRIARNDAVNAARVERMRPEAIVLSPGPCTPKEAGGCLDLVRQFHTRLPILGICLGHQVIVEALGGRVVQSNQPIHGRASMIMHDGAGVFARVPNPTSVGRYHALIAEAASLPESLQVSARTEDGTIMAVRHRALPVIGLQFHPESILTDCGFDYLANFLRMAGLDVRRPRTDRNRARNGARSTAEFAPPRPVTF